MKKVTFDWKYPAAEVHTSPEVAEKTPLARSNRVFLEVQDTSVPPLSLSRSEEQTLEGFDIPVVTSLLYFLFGAS